MEKFTSYTVHKNSSFVLGFSLLAAVMLSGTVFSPNVFAQPIKDPISDSSKNPAILAENLVCNGIKLVKSGQYHQARFEFLGALKQVYPLGTAFVIKSDKTEKTILLGENDEAIVYAHLFQDGTKNSFEIKWKNPYPIDIADFEK